MSKVISNQSDELISTAEAAEILRRDVRTIHRWVESGRLTPAYKAPGIRGVRLFNRSDIDTLAGELAAAS